MRANYPWKPRRFAEKRSHAGLRCSSRRKYWATGNQNGSFAGNAVSTEVVGKASLGIALADLRFVLTSLSPSPRSRASAGPHGALGL